MWRTVCVGILCCVAVHMVACNRKDGPATEPVIGVAFDTLQTELALPAEGRSLLEAAAILHDSGYHIAYERHHLHSFHLISYAKLPGFKASEIRAKCMRHRGHGPFALPFSLLGPPQVSYAARFAFFFAEAQ